jgi:hypothetical protein
LIGYCCFNSFIVYGYQLICLEVFPIFNYLKETDNIILQNLPSIGLINYENKELLYKLLPHFLSNFLSILIYYELKSIYDRIDNNNKSYINNNININFIDDNINSEDNIPVNNNKENKDDILDKNIIVNDNLNENKEKEEMKEIFEINTDSNKEGKNDNIKEEENPEVKTDNEINTSEKNIEEKIDGNIDLENNNDIETKKKDIKIVDIEKIGINIEEEENIYNLKNNLILNKNPNLLKIDELIRILEKIPKKIFFHKLALNYLMKNNIDINNEELISLLKIGNSKTYQKKSPYISETLL